MDILIINTIRAIRALWADSQFKSLAKLTAIALGSGVVWTRLEREAPAQAALSYRL